jgi:Flp pilus assembly protein TadD
MRSRMIWAILVAVSSVSSLGCSQFGKHFVSKATIEARQEARATSLDTALSAARIREHQGRLREARELYEKLELEDSENATIHHRLGVISSIEADYDQADQQFAQALQMAPHDPEIMIDYGYSLFLQNDLDAAEQMLRAALEESPTNERAINNLAIVQGHAGKTGECLALFRQTVGQAEANANLGFIHAQCGEGQKAAERFSRALTLDSNLKHAAYALVEIAEISQHASESAESDAGTATLAGADPLNQATPVAIQ